VILKTSDLKTAGATTRYAGFHQIQLPLSYVTGETIRFRLRGGMVTTVADTSCTADLECYLSDGNGGCGSDICSTSAQSINSLSFADKYFVINESGLVAGNILAVRVAIICNDAAGGAAVYGAISELDSKST